MRFPFFHLVGLVGSVNAHSISHQNATNQSMALSFADIPITSTLEYVPCFQNYTCTNLRVPLDYTNHSVGFTHIAFIKHTAAKQPAKGDILFNPGGPGESAVGTFVGPSFDTLPYLLGDEWNIVGMDTRGVNNSGPSADCFKHNPTARDYYDGAFGSIDRSQSDASKRDFFADAGSFGDWCSQTLTDEANHINTPAIAADMLYYAELLHESQGKSKNDAKVNYYGISYGSILGNTFAQVYPDRIRKFILDGISDATGYYFGTWAEFIQQGDESMMAFFDSCFEAGPRCAFFRNDSSPADIKNRFDAILADLNENPIIVADPEFVDYPTFVGTQDLGSRLILDNYNSVAAWPSLGRTLSDLEHRNGSLLAFTVNKGWMLPSAPYTEYSKLQSRALIGCNDNKGAGGFNVSSLEKLNELYALNKNSSFYLGDRFTQTFLPQCRKLRFEPPESQKFKGFEKVNTSNPILFVNAKIDPVSSSQEKFAAFYERSSIVLNDAIAHSFPNAPSMCIAEDVQKCLSTGELPPFNKLCKADAQPFDPVPV